jgi:hypothetical protein
MKHYDEAQAELARIDAEITRWREELAQKDLAARSLPAIVSPRVLSGALTPQQAAKQVAELEDELVVITSVLSELSQQRAAAERRVKQAQLADLEALLADLEAQQEELEDKLAEAQAVIREVDPDAEVYSPRLHALVTEVTRLGDAILYRRLHLESQPPPTVRTTPATGDEGAPATRYEVRGVLSA